MRITDVKSEKLIEAVKKRPALYNKSDTMYYCQKKNKIKLWIEVCQEVFSNWEQMSAHEKVELRHEILKRWKSLRTCFSRELSLQKKEKRSLEIDHEPIKRRKKYEYFGLMSFLLHPDAIGEFEITKETDEESSDPLDCMKTEIYDEGQTSKVEIVNESVNNQFQPFYERNENVDEKILEILKEMKKDECDEDRQFMLSLVPSFRKLNDKQKFEARIGMLKVLQEITFQEKETL
ncbi:uncharacterized protein LOC114242391 [Bombyx mandarina]|uniref:BESS domain-containing protein n=2 Tax=Bombyx TaxID=7090 RepID=A0A8R2AP92_BOMMO|nr:uncharacterized protein LOC101737675 [Bombyx mori]XP_028029331.1 uncharacterized protein LOC114242391 [Bombyx mandarina]